MKNNINEIFDKVMDDLGIKKTLDKSEKIVYSDINKVNVFCNSSEEFLDLYYKNEIIMNISCDCGMKYKVYIEPDEIVWEDLKLSMIGKSKKNKRDNFYCLNCGIPIYIIGGQIKNIWIKEFKGNIDD